MCVLSKKKKSPDSIEILPRLSIKEVRLQIESAGYNFGKVIRGYESGRVSKVSGTMSWSLSASRGLHRSSEKYAEIRYSLGKDTDGVYFQINYKLKLPTETEYHPVRQRYYLVARESNLKPGTYRYFFADPFSDSGLKLCTKLYCLDGYFYPRSYIQKEGVLYRQQREGHTERYVWTFSSRVPETWRKFGKTHYRGKITPGYRRFLDISDESERRRNDYFLKKCPLLYSWTDVPI